MAEDPNPQDAPDWKAIAAQFANGLLTEGVPGIVKAWQAANIETHGAVRALDINLGVDVVAFIAEHWRGTEEALMPLIGALVAPIVEGLFGSKSGGADYSRRMAAGDGAGVARAIVDGFLAAVAGNTAAPVQPGTEGSLRLATAAVQATLESQLNALIPEIVSDFLPLDFGKVTALMELPEGIIRTLGVSRLVRRSLAPLVDATCATPAKWHYGKLYRQSLLGAGEVSRQLARGHWTRDQALEELARAGYSDDRIEALLNAAAKFRSVSDAFRLVRASQWSLGEAAQHLKDQGYDDVGAATELQLERLKVIESFERSMASAAVDAYVAGRISEGELGGFVTGATIDAQEKAQYTELAHARRALSLRPLSPSEAMAAVKARILNVRDYRDALERDGRTEEAVTVLELLLRAELDKETSIEKHREAQDAERKAEKQAKIDAAAAKKAAIDAQRALERRGKRADLERAAIRGLLPLSRVAELYAATYDADTAGTLLDLLEADRQAYVDAAAARAEALKRAGSRAADVGQLETAVTEGILTLSEFRDRLLQLKFPDADATLLVSTLAAKMQDTADARAQRDQAAAAAKVKHLDLHTIETLVRRGHRTMGEYDRTLADLGFDDAARAAMLELLQVQIDDDAKARAARAAAEAAAQVKGLSFEQFRRAVLLGTKTDAEFQTFMIQQGYTVAAQQTLLASLRADVAEAEAARKRRAAAEAAKDRRDAPLADVARAARLGLIPVDAYAARLLRSGFSQDDVDLEVDLLVEEMAAIATARQKREEADAAAKARGVSLPTLERAVKAGVTSIASYSAAAAAAGFTPEAVDTLTRLLQAELDAAAAAEARRKEIAAAAAVHHVSLAQRESAVLDGVSGIDSYAAAVAQLGYPDEDVQLLVGLLAHRLEVQAAARARQKALDAANAVKAITRADVARGVLEGFRTAEQYAAWLTTEGYQPDDIPLLVSLVTADKARRDDQEARRKTLAAANPSRELARGDVAKGVVAGLRTSDEYAAWLAEQGYEPDDVELLVDLVALDVQKAADKAAAKDEGG